MGSSCRDLVQCQLQRVSLKVLIRLCDEGNSNFYKSDKVFVKLVSKCSELYKEGHCDLFDVLYVVLDKSRNA